METGARKWPRCRGWFVAEYRKEQCVVLFSIVVITRSEYEYTRETQKKWG